MKFETGQSVNVRLAGLIIAGVIKKVGKPGEYIVQFEGGTEKSIQEKLIKPDEDQQNYNSAAKLNSRLSSRRSPARQSPGRSRSQLSPSPSRRSPGRPRIRASPSPARRSPGRPRKKSASPISDTRNSTPTRILKVSLENIDTSGDFSTLNKLRKRKPVEHVTDASAKSEKLMTITNDNIVESEVVIPTFKEDYEKNNRILNLNQQTGSLINDIGKFSDDDEIITEVKLPLKERKSELRTLRLPREFGGWFGAFLLIFLIPVSVFSLHVFCNQNICSFTQLPNFNKYKLPNTYFDAKALVTYIGYVLLLSVLSKIPYTGRKISSQPSKDKIYVYRMNGLFSAFCTLALIIGLEIQNIPVVNFLTEKYFQLLVSSLIVGLVISVLLFIKSRYVAVSLLNPYASTYNFVYDFFMGRQVNPRVSTIDVKMVLLRASYIAVLILNSIYIFKSLNVSLNSDSLLSLNQITLDPTLLICAGFQIFYILDLLLFETHLTTTFELQYEGLGYMKTMLYASYPFFMTATTKYLYESNTAAQNLVLGAVCFVFSVGYVMYRASNLQKNAFRLNPYDPALSRLESMPTGQGKKLIISGWWGRLRHPNYCGDILMHLSIGALCAGSPAGLGVLPPALMLAMRAARDSSRCRRRYGSAWDRYTQRVRYSIVPLVY